MDALEKILEILLALLGVVGALWYNARRAAQDNARVDELEKERTALEQAARVKALAEAEDIVATDDANRAERFMDDSLRVGIPSATDTVSGPGVADKPKA